MLGGVWAEKEGGRGEMQLGKEGGREGRKFDLANFLSSRGIEA